MSLQPTKTNVENRRYIQIFFKIADWRFNLSFSAEREKETNRVHSFSTIPDGVMDTTKNSFLVLDISMMSPTFICSMGSI